MAVKDMIGQRFGKLMVISFTKVKKENAYWLCKCDCGKEKEIVGFNLRRGQTKSCGCLQPLAVKLTGQTHIKHGLCRKGKIHPLFIVWNGMVARCTKTNEPAYKNYGGRGITVCEEWRSDFKAFYDWAMANGWQKGLQIDRENNDGNYEPTNCRFVTRLVNCRNRRSTKVNYPLAQQIRLVYTNGARICDIVYEYKLSRSHIEAIINYKIWQEAA